MWRSRDQQLAREEEGRAAALARGAREEEGGICRGWRCLKKRRASLSGWNITVEEFWRYVDKKKNIASSSERVVLRRFGGGKNCDPWDFAQPSQGREAGRQASRPGER